MRIIIFIMLPSQGWVGGETQAQQLASPCLQTVKICSTNERREGGEMTGGRGGRRGMREMREREAKCVFDLKMLKQMSI